MISTKGPFFQKTNTRNWSLFSKFTKTHFKSKLFIFNWYVDVLWDLINFVGNTLLRFSVFKVSFVMPIRGPKTKQATIFHQDVMIFIRLYILKFTWTDPSLTFGYLYMTLQHMKNFVPLLYGKIFNENLLQKAPPLHPRSCG